MSGWRTVFIASDGTKVENSSGKIVVAGMRWGFEGWDEG